MQEIPAEASNGYVAMVVHVFVSFANELNVYRFGDPHDGRGKGDKEIVLTFLLIFEKNNLRKWPWQEASLDPTWTSNAFALMLPSAGDSPFRFLPARCISARE